MSLQSDKDEVISFLNFLRKKEAEFLAYRNLFAAMNRQYPHEQLGPKYLKLVDDLKGMEIQQKYAGLAERVQSATDQAALLAEVLNWIQSREK